MSAAQGSQRLSSNTRLGVTHVTYHGVAIHGALASLADVETRLLDGGRSSTLIHGVSPSRSAPAPNPCHASPGIGRTNFRCSEHCVYLRVKTNQTSTATAATPTTIEAIRAARAASEGCPRPCVGHLLRLQTRAAARRGHLPRQSGGDEMIYLSGECRALAGAQALAILLRFRIPNGFLEHDQVL